MKFSERWLRQWVDPPVSTKQLVEQLTLAGLEVESVTPVATLFKGVTVAQIQEVRPHPKSDHLKVCTVDCGADRLLTVICGAPNVRPGLRVPLAQVGAQLPGAAPLDRLIVQGVVSEGMLCSAAELGLGEATQGLLELPQEAPLGEDLWDFLALDDHSIELNPTPNRGDCLGIAGIAREIGALNQCTITGPLIKPVSVTIEDILPIEIMAPAACPRYVGRIIRGIDPSAPTPIWMQERLRRSGYRTIGAVVDITNYVMLELGQPMHAFDLERLRGGIRVRFAEQGETITVLDGQGLTLRDNTLVIADWEGAVAVAGIMGGIETAVTEHTRDVFLESAFFTPQVMAGQARHYRLQTESSHRFERGVDFDLQARAIERATELLVETCGGQPGPVVDRRFEAYLPQRNPIILRASRITRLLGMRLADSEVSEPLARLGMKVEPGKERWCITPPSFRFDIAIEADLIEEIARLTGYARIPSLLPQVRLKTPRNSETEIPLHRLRQVLVDRGYHEAITYSFVNPEIQSKLDPESQALALANPISTEMGVMRTTLWPGLIQALLYNQNRQCERVRLFEIGLVFTRLDTGLSQREVIGGIITGSPYPEQWGTARREVDFYDLKGDVEALLALVDAPQAFVFTPLKHPALHPGQASTIERDGMGIGMMGTLHPAVAHGLGVEGKAFLFQIDLTALTRGKLPNFKPISKFPIIRRDICILLDREISASQVINCIANEAPEVLKELQLFDLYQGESIDPGEKSLALGLIFQGTSSTLIDKDINTMMERILARLSEKLGARLRD